MLFVTMLHLSFKMCLQVPCIANYLTHTSAVIVVLLPIKSKAGKFNDIEAIWFTFGRQLDIHLVDLISNINNIENKWILIDNRNRLLTGLL